MWPWTRSANAVLWLGASTWAWRVDGRDLASGGLVGTSPHDLAAQVLNVPVPRLPAGARVAVILDDRWVRSCVVVPPSNVGTLADLRLCARARLDALFGDDQGLWHVQSHEHPGKPFVVCALPANCTIVFEKLSDALKTDGASLAFVAPLWSIALADAARRKKDGWLAIRSDRTVTLLKRAQRHVVHVRSVAGAQAASDVQMQQMFELERMRHGTNGGTVGEKLDVVEARNVLAAPTIAAPHGSFRFDSQPSKLAKPGGHVASQGWTTMWPGALALGMAGLVAGVSLPYWRAGQQQLQDKEAEYRVLSKQAPSERVPAKRSKPVGEISAQTLDGITQRLNMPWSTMLVGLEQANTARIGLLTLEPDAQRQRVKASGLAKDEAAMFDYLRRVQASTAFRDVRLARHELDEKAPGRPVRFQFEARVVALPMMQDARP